MIVVIRCNAAPTAHDYVMKALAMSESVILYQRQGRRYIAEPQKIDRQGWINLCSFLIMEHVLSFEIVQDIQFLRTGDKMRLKKKKSIA